MDTDEFRFHTPDSKAGILFVRSLPDDVVITAARDRTSMAYEAIADYMGPGTNPSWITARAVEEAYRRDLINETELDYLTP